MIDKLAGATISEDFYYKPRSNESKISSDEKSLILESTKTSASHLITTISKVSCDDDLKSYHSKNFARSMKNVELGDYVGALQNFAT